MADETKPNTDSKPTEREIDVGAGVKVRMSEGEAEKYISWQKERNETFNTYKSKNDELESKRKAAEDRAILKEREAQQLEMMKAGEMDKLKESITAEYKNKIAQLESKIVDYSIKDTIKSIENVNPNAVDDIMVLVKSKGVKVEGDNIIVNEKKLDEALKEIINGRDYFKTVKTTVGTGSGVKTPQGKNVQQKSIGELLLSK
jgi:hypothetical protein